jgi:hypothetical protein
LEQLGIDGRRAGLIWLTIGTGGGCFEKCNELLGSVRYGEFLD